MATGRRGCTPCTLAHACASAIAYTYALVHSLYTGNRVIKLPSWFGALNSPATLVVPDADNHWARKLRVDFSDADLKLNASA